MLIDTNGMTDERRSGLPAAIAPPAKTKLRRVRGMSAELQSTAETMAEHLIDRQLAGSLHREAGETVEKLTQAADGIVALQTLMRPGDAVESMIVAQLIALQNATMKNLAAANVPGQNHDIMIASLNAANKCSRTFATLIETLNRHRGKGQQKVTVEHVHVHSGGQAIVGNVTKGGGGYDAESAD